MSEKKPRVFVCSGSSCTKKKSKQRKMIKQLSKVAAVTKVDCQDICDGPVAGIEKDGKIQWFRDLSTRKERDALVTLLRTGELKKRLKKRRAGKGG